MNQYNADVKSTRFTPQGVDADRKLLNPRSTTAILVLVCLTILAISFFLVQAFFGESITSVQSKEESGELLSESVSLSELSQEEQESFKQLQLYYGDSLRIGPYSNTKYDYSFSVPGFYVMAIESGENPSEVQVARKVELNVIDPKTRRGAEVQVEVLPDAELVVSDMRGRVADTRKTQDITLYVTELVTDQAATDSFPDRYTSAIVATRGGDSIFWRVVIRSVGTPKASLTESAESVAYHQMIETHVLDSLVLEGETFLE